MTQYIIDATTGTVLDISNCFIVDAEHLGDDDHSDSELGTIAQVHGISVMAMARDTGNGDNKYRYTVSYSPLSIKDEAYSLLDGGVYEEDEAEKKALTWASETATREQLETISNLIMGQDSVWNDFRENLMEGLMWVYKEENK